MRYKNPRIGTGLRLIIISAFFYFFVNPGFTQPIPTNGLYVDQTPPGSTPRRFVLSVNPGFFAGERIAISNDGKYIYYSEIKGYYPNTGESVKMYSYADGKWSGPFKLFDGYAAPALSVGGDTMYFEKNFETFISARNGKEWSNPKRILTRLDSAHYLQVARNGNYYVSSRSKTGIGLGDWCKVIINGSDTSATSLGGPINTVGENLDFFVSRDESFMILTSHQGFAISYNNYEGGWTMPINLGSKINSGLGMWGPYVSNDNKYLFYTTGTKQDYSDVSVYWVRIDGIIDSIKKTLLSDQKNDSVTNDRLFGNPPDSIPVVFAKGIISMEDRYEYGLAISPDYREIFFTAESPARGLSVMKRSDTGDWTFPETANLRGINAWEFEAFYTCDGSKLYFSSDVNDTSRLWCSVKSENRWSSPVLMKSPVNSTPVFWATVAKSNTMYYTNLSVFQIYKSHLTDGQYKETEKGGVAFGIHPYISPNEDFILFNGKGDIYIAFRTKEGKWTEPIKLGNQINSVEYDETCPSLSPDGKYIFFSRYNDKNGKSDLYWVSSSIIERIKVNIIK